MSITKKSLRNKMIAEVEMPAWFTAAINSISKTQNLDNDIEKNIKPRTTFSTPTHI